MGSLGSWIDPEELRRCGEGGVVGGEASGEQGAGEIDALAAISALLSEPVGGEVEPLIAGGLDDEQAYLAERFPSPVSQSVAAIRKTLAELGESGREQGLFSGVGGGVVVEGRAEREDLADGGEGLRAGGEGGLRFVVDVPTALAREKMGRWVEEPVGEVIDGEGDEAEGGRADGLGEEVDGADSGGVLEGVGEDGGSGVGGVGQAAGGIGLAGSGTEGGVSGAPVKLGSRIDLGAAGEILDVPRLGPELNLAIDQLMAVTFSRGASVFDGEGYELCSRGESLAVAVLLPILRAWRRMEEEMGAGVASGLGVEVAGRRVELWPVDESKSGGIVVVLSGAASFARPDLEEVSRVLGG